MQQQWHLHCFTVLRLGSASVVVHSVNQRLCRNQHRSGSCDLSQLLAWKITKGIHSCKPVLLNFPNRSLSGNLSESRNHMWEVKSSQCQTEDSNLRCGYVHLVTAHHLYLATGDCDRNRTQRDPSMLPGVVYFCVENCWWWFVLVFVWLWLLLSNTRKCLGGKPVHVFVFQKGNQKDACSNPEDDVRLFCWHFSSLFFSFFFFLCSLFFLFSWLALKVQLHAMQPGMFWNLAWRRLVTWA